MLDANRAGRISREEEATDSKIVRNLVVSKK